MGLFDVFRGKKKEERGLALPVERRALNPFEALRPLPAAAPIKTGIFEAFRPAPTKEPERKSIEDVFVSREERGSRFRAEPEVFRSETRPNPVFARPEVPAETIETLLPRIFDLGSVFRDAETARQSAWFRAQVEEAAHTGEPASYPMGEVSVGRTLEEALGRLLGLPVDDPNDALDAVTSAFQLAQPEGLPGWFQLSWDGSALILEYLEVPYRPGMHGVFDFLRPKKKSGNLPALPGKNLPAKADPFEIMREEPEKRLSKEKREGSVFEVFRPKEKKKALPARQEEESTPFSYFAPGSAPRSIEEAIVPEGERGSRYRKEEDPFKEEAPPPAAPQAAPGSEVPPEGELDEYRVVTRNGKKYYLPISVRQVADRMIEMFDVADLRRAIMEERESPEFRLAFMEEAMGEGSEESAYIPLTHMSIDSGPSEVEVYSEFFNIPIDLFMAYLGDEDRDEEYLEGWEALNEEILWPLFHDILPAAWDLIMPGLPGRIIIESSRDDGCPEMIYTEYAPEGYKVNEKEYEKLREEVYGPSRPRPKPGSEPEEDEDEMDDLEESEEE